MIDPHNITNFNRSTTELEELLLFCVSVAGKRAIPISKKIDDFLSEDRSITPFQLIKRFIDNGILEQKIRNIRLGRYSTLVAAFTKIINMNLDLRTCSVDDLESIPGIGPKTSRFFIVHSRYTNDYAVLDTHVLSWLKVLGYDVKQKYKTVEQYFLNEAKQRNMDIAEIDLKIWSASSNKKTLLGVIPYAYTKLA